MNKEGKESCSSNTRPACSSSNTRPATSTHQSFFCSSNRKHIKRRRINITKPKSMSMEESLSLELEAREARVVEKEIELGLRIDHEAVTSRQNRIFTLKNNGNTIKKKKKEQLGLGYAEHMERLLGIFASQNVSFKRKSSGGKSTRSCRTSGRSVGRSSGPYLRSNSSINMPHIEEDSRNKVTEAVLAMAKAEFIDMKDIPKDRSFILSDEVVCQAFLLYDYEVQV